MSEYDEKMHGLVHEKIDRIEAEWVAGRLNAESMESLLRYARGGADMALAGAQIADASKAIVTEMEVKVFRSELEIAEKEQTLKDSPAVVLEKLAETFDQWAGNVSYNNRSEQRPEWDGRMKAFYEAAREARRWKRRLLG